VTESKEKLDKTIGLMIARSSPHRDIARRLFLYDFNSVFTIDPDRGFLILNAVCDNFKLPFSAVKVVGSAQTGYSYYSKRDFVPGKSDLDIAIISAALFQQYSEETYWMTRRYSDLSRFPRQGGISVAQDFRNYLGSGNFRPDLMPESATKTSWFGFFNRLSNKHTDLFRDINAGIYLSERFFEMKNASLIEEYGKGRP
jgi:hypothetical protein